jgi:hypothetical protein
MLDAESQSTMKLTVVFQKVPEGFADVQSSLPAFAPVAGAMTPPFSSAAISSRE